MFPEPCPWLPAVCVDPLVLDPLVLDPLEPEPLEPEPVDAGEPAPPVTSTSFPFPVCGAADDPPAVAPPGEVSPAEVVPVVEPVVAVSGAVP